MSRNLNHNLNCNYSYSQRRNLNRMTLRSLNYTLSNTRKRKPPYNRRKPVSRKSQHNNLCIRRIRESNR